MLARAADADNPVRAIMTSRGQGALPLESGFFTLDNTTVHVSAVKQAENGNGFIIRLFNPSETAQTATLSFQRPIAAASRCRMDESTLHPLNPIEGELPLSIEPKKIYTLCVEL